MNLIDSVASFFRPAPEDTVPAPTPIEALEREVSETAAAAATIEARLDALDLAANDAAAIGDRDRILELEREISTDRRLLAVANRRASDAARRLDDARTAEVRAQVEAEEAERARQIAELDAELTPEALHAQLGPVHERIREAARALQEAAADHDRILAEQRAIHAERRRLGPAAPPAVEADLATLALAATFADDDPDALYRLFDDGSGQSWSGSVLSRGLALFAAGADRSEVPLESVVASVGVSWLRPYGRGTRSTGPRHADALRDVARVLRTVRTMSDFKASAVAMLRAAVKAERAASAPVEATPTEVPAAVFESEAREVVIPSRYLPLAQYD